MTMTRLTRAVVPFLLLSASACASGGGGSGSLSGPPIVVEVRNNNFSDGTVFAARDGERLRLGMVTGKTDQSFAIPWGPNMILRLEVYFIGGDACATRAIQMEPGQRYLLELQPDTRVNPECRPMGG